jgi:hypothetical protein
MRSGSHYDGQVIGLDMDSPSNKTVSVYESPTSCSHLAIAVYICILSSDMKDRSSHKDMYTHSGTDSIQGLELDYG